MEYLRAGTTSLVGQAAPKHKGKISRSLAAKSALAIRCDALGDGQDNAMGVENRLKLEARLRNLEGKDLGRLSGSAKGKPKIAVYDKDKKGSGGLITPAKTYNTAADSLLQTPKADSNGVKEKKDKKKKKKADSEAEEEPKTEEPSKKKSKKKKTEVEPETEEASKKEKKKKRKHEEEETEMPAKKKEKTEKKKKKKKSEV